MSRPVASSIFLIVGRRLGGAAQMKRGPMKEGESRFKAAAPSFCRCSNFLRSSQLEMVKKQ
jgi:hypothetical protein